MAPYKCIIIIIIIVIIIILKFRLDVEFLYVIDYKYSLQLITFSS